MRLDTLDDEKESKKAKHAAKLPCSTFFNMENQTHAFYRTTALRISRNARPLATANIIKQLMNM